MTTSKVAIIGSGNIGTDLMFKIIRNSDILEVGAMVGIDPIPTGWPRAPTRIPVTHGGVAGLIAMPHFDEIDIVLDATSAKAHIANAAVLTPLGKKLVDLTPAALGPWLSRREPGSRPRYAQRQHGDLWWSGHHPDRGGSVGGNAGALCGDRGVHRLPVGGSGHPRQHR
ncbi:hypothetical protein [Mycolicibacterium frederiksbergense]|uniref:hypothetical protein n=1 Tax=Mycolicibacterium frederiksbergense TaxID=117567 RepID=UPI00344DF139